MLAIFFDVTEVKNLSTQEGVALYAAAVEAHRRTQDQEAAASSAKAPTAKRGGLW